MHHKSQQLLSETTKNHRRPILLEFSREKGLKQSKLCFYTGKEDIWVEKMFNQNPVFRWYKNSSNSHCVCHFQSNGRPQQGSTTHFLSAAMADSEISVVASSLSSCCPGGQSMVATSNLL